MVTHHGSGTTSISDITSQNEITFLILALKTTDTLKTKKRFLKKSIKISGEAVNEMKQIV